MRFEEGKKVVCISEDFPVLTTTEIDKSHVGKQAPTHPKLREVLVVDEILGDFLRFDKYDTDAFNWWHSSRFKPLDEVSITISITEEDHSLTSSELVVK